MEIDVRTSIKKEAARPLSPNTDRSSTVLLTNEIRFAQLV